MERYIEKLNVSVHRQVEIEAKLYDVTLNDQFQFGIDWEQIVRVYSGDLAFIGQPSFLPNVSPPFGAEALRAIDDLMAEFGNAVIGNNVKPLALDTMVDGLFAGR